MRILLNDIIRTACVETLATNVAYEDCFATSGMADEARKVIDDLAKDICATAPQYTLRCSLDDDPTLRLCCYTLLFPLYVAALYASPATNITPWVVRQLRFLAKDFDMKNASVVAELLEGEEKTGIWDVYAILGSYAFAA